MRRPGFSLLLWLLLMSSPFAAPPDSLSLRWGLLTYPPGTAALAELKPPPGAKGEWLHLRSPEGGTAGANSGPLPRLAGRLRFRYRAARTSGMEDNLRVHVIPLNAGGKEDGKAGRTTFVVPKEHVGDGKTHAGTLEYNFIGKAVAQVILAPRVNEGGGAGPGEFWVGRVEWEPLPARLEMRQFGPELPYAPHEVIHSQLLPPVTYLRSPIMVRAALRNTGGEPMKLTGLRLLAEPMTVTPVGAFPDILHPMETVRLEWRVHYPIQELFIPLRLVREEGGKAQTLAAEPLAWGVKSALLRGQRRPRVGAVHARREPGGPAHLIALRASGPRSQRPPAFLFPLASLTLDGGETHYFLPEATDAAPEDSREKLSWESAGETKNGAPFRWKMELIPSHADQLELAVTLRADRDLRILRFAGPTLRVGWPQPRPWAHFPGLEYLVGDQRSSENDGDPEHLKLRFRPHPYKVTQPWIAAGVGREAVGLAWDPNQTWLSEDAGRKEATSFPKLRS
ncbi:MAG: hypothetical protein KY468_06065, partial [Armatimonadetes bacterium]|nr:hypothetical protein [Armatimonadota bacterium]